MVDSTDGSSTSTFWNRRSSAASFSTYLRYSSSVVAPTQWSSPRASAGFSMLPASMAPFGLAGADHGVQLVDEDDRAAFVGGDVLQHGLEALLELAAVLGTREQRRHVERQHALVLERLGHLAVDDALREPFDDGGLADAGLADEHGIVLAAALEDLDGAADLVVAADDRIELAVAGARREVDRVLGERLALAFRFLRVDLAAATHDLDGVLERLRVRPFSFRMRPVSPLSPVSASRNSSLEMNWSPRLTASLSVRLRGC
jgi:hypothetical protein